jgi:hypothetical protein
MVQVRLSPLEPRPTATHSHHAAWACPLAPLLPFFAHRPCVKSAPLEPCTAPLPGGPIHRTLQKTSSPTSCSPKPPAPSLPCAQAGPRSHFLFPLCFNQVSQWFFHCVKSRPQEYSLAPLAHLISHLSSPSTGASQKRPNLHFHCAFFLVHGDRCFHMVFLRIKLLLTLLILVQCFRSLDRVATGHHALHCRWTPSHRPLLFASRPPQCLGKILPRSSCPARFPTPHRTRATGAPNEPPLVAPLQATWMRWPCWCVHPCTEMMGWPGRPPSNFGPAS